MYYFLYTLNRSACLLLLTVSIIAGSSPVVFAQYEYLATLNYQDLSVNRPGSPIPGVTRVVPNSAYDQNQQRFFFQGFDGQSGPFHLYTINATNGQCY